MLRPLQPGRGHGAGTLVRVASAACCLVLGATVGGCGGSQPRGHASAPHAESGSPGSPSASSSGGARSPRPARSTPTPSTATTPAGTGAPTHPTGPTTSDGSGDPATLRERLLTAGELPGLIRGSRWHEAGTARERPSTSFGTCQRFSITAIGAERAVVRRFRPAPTRTGAGSHTGAVADSAGELLARFPDTLTARRAYAVLEAWQQACRHRLSRWQHVHVGEVQDLSAGDRAGSYLLTYGPVRGRPDARYLDAQGMVLRGSRVAMVSLRLAGPARGPAWDQEHAQRPMATALDRAAGKLG